MISYTYGYFMHVNYTTWSHKAANKKYIGCRAKCQVAAKKFFNKALQMCTDHAGSGSLLPN